MVDADRELIEIQNKIAEGVYVLRENDTKNCKGKHWTTFRIIVREDGGRLPNLYACSAVNCLSVVRTNLTKDGTGKLSRHYRTCKSSERIGVDSYFEREFRPPAAKRIKTHHREAVNNAAVSFVITDMRPADAVTKNGLVELLSVFTQIGSHYGSMAKEDVMNLLPSRFSVSFHQDHKIKKYNRKKRKTVPNAVSSHI